MKKLDGYMRGIGIGGWLTNYKRMKFQPADRRNDVTIGDLEHFERYITEADVANIASFGIDHIRLAFDQVVLEEFEHPYVYREEVFRHIDNFLLWAKKYGLNVILNLHHAFGCYCDADVEKPLLDTPEYRERFVRFWEYMERRYHHTGREVMFELMNEVTDADSTKWISLYRETVAAIRAMAPTRLIMIGSASWNSPNKLRDLEVLDDENVVYTFHFYDPYDFTHQRTTLNVDTMYYNREFPYPGDIAVYRHYQQTVYHNHEAYSDVERMDREWLHAKLAPVKAFIDAHPEAIVTCGEFGTIRHARRQWRENWFADVIAFLDAHGVPFTVWNYLSTPYDCNRFSLVDDDDRKPVLPELMERLRMR